MIQLPVGLSYHDAGWEIKLEARSRFNYGDFEVYVKHRREEAWRAYNDKLTAEVLEFFKTIVRDGLLERKTVSYLRKSTSAYSKETSWVRPEGKTVQISLGVHLDYIVLSEMRKGQILARLARGLQKKLRTTKNK